MPDKINKTTILTGTLILAVMLNQAHGSDNPAQTESIDSLSYTNAPSGSAFPEFRHIDYIPVTLTAPNGGESWPAGTYQEISWTSETDSGHVDIWLYKGGLRSAFLGYVPLTDGSFKWYIPTPITTGGDYSIRLLWMNDSSLSYEDFSDAPFTITGDLPTPTFELSSPNGGESWPADSVQTITWNSINPTGMVELWFLDHSKTQALFIDKALAAAGQYSWPIPVNLDSDNGKILIRWSNQILEIQDTSDADFEINQTITPQLAVASPAGGETWTTGTTETITWDANFTHGIVNINLMKNGDLYSHLGSIPIAQGYMDWHICPAIENGNGYYVNLSLSDLNVEADSGTLTVTGSQQPLLTLDYPNEGETWSKGNPYTINWTVNNLAGDLEIILPDTVGTNWGHVFIPIDEGSYTWSAPSTITAGQFRVTILSTNCGIKISDSATVTIEESVTLPGDIDGDGDIDLYDLAKFQACFTGPSSKLLTPPCSYFDFSPDADVDLEDYAEMHSRITGP